MTDQQQNLAERPHRFTAHEIPSLEVTVRRSDIFDKLEEKPLSGATSHLSDASQVISQVASVYNAEVIDFSCKGLKLALPFSAQFEELLVIRLDFRDIEYSYQGQANVRHIREENEVWIAGCSIEPHIPAAIIDHLANVSGKERRRDPRISVFGEGWARRPGDVDGNPAVVHNISLGGFCITVKEEVTIGERIQFLIYNKTGKLETFEVLPRWQSKTADGWLLGCSFEESYTFKRLNWCLALNEPRTILQKVDSIKWYVVAASLMAMFIPPAVPLAMNAIQAKTRPTVAEYDPSSPINPTLPMKSSEPVPSGNSTESFVNAPEGSSDFMEPPVPEFKEDPIWETETAPSELVLAPFADPVDPVEPTDRVETKYTQQEPVTDEQKSEQIVTLITQDATESTDRRPNLDALPPDQPPVNDGPRRFLISTNTRNPHAKNLGTGQRWTNKSYTLKRESEFEFSDAKSSRRNSRDEEQK